MNLKKKADNSVSVHQKKLTSSYNGTIVNSFEINF